MIEATHLLVVSVFLLTVAATLAFQFYNKAQAGQRELARYQHIRDAEQYVAQQHAALQHVQQQANAQFEAKEVEVREWRDEQIRHVDQYTTESRATIAQAQQEAQAQLDAKEAERSRAEEQLAKIAHDTKLQMARSAQARVELQLLEEAQDVQSFGFYKARYSLDTPDEYKQKLEEVRNAQKAMISAGTAVQCPAEWTVQGSAAKGRKMVREQMKLMLRAFNGESDAAIAKVKYNNADSLERRIGRAFESINKLGSTKETTISDEYARLKLNELYLAHEYQEKLQEQREEQRRIREELKEAEKAEREIAKAVADAEGEEDKFQAALERARAQASETSGKQLEKLEQLVQKLERELSAAIDRKVKATARAQLVKSGHVYVLSNIGSFGADVYKIGMTRRFEPLERVKELGDASVPFGFDVHAMIYSEDAPRLEGMLHKEFAERRVNLINLRREYFKVTLDEIRLAVAKHHGIVTFVLEPEAEEHRKTLAKAAPANDTRALQA